MRLKNDEEIVKVFHHHLTARLIRGCKIVVAGLPFFLVAWFLRDLFTPSQMMNIYVVVGLLTAIPLIYDSFFYHMDRLIITNNRILFIDWNGAFTRTEHEAELSDIQNIVTKEMGIFSLLKIFDYGDFIVETASTHKSIFFPCAPDPEGIKHFIYHLNIKPNRIGGESSNIQNDQTGKTAEDASFVAEGQQRR
ncbi:PH domain-containing protein [Patescibacteria group bacterium]|nr:PH domain-containing protein [Patescibacteria group bacterium]MBU1954146.1 PH domain-containing protein [Patescibacteria group bacterium]